MALVGPIAYFTRVYCQYIEATQNSTAVTNSLIHLAEQSILMTQLAEG